MPRKSNGTVFKLSSFTNTKTTLILKVVITFIYM